jgi:hypothetical protein
LGIGCFLKRCFFKKNEEFYDKHNIIEVASIHWLNKAQIKSAKISKLMDIAYSAARNTITGQQENG